MKAKKPRAGTVIRRIREIFDDDVRDDVVRLFDWTFEHLNRFFNRFQTLGLQTKRKKTKTPVKMLKASNMYQALYELSTANETNSMIQKTPIKMDKLKMTRILLNRKRNIYIALPVRQVLL